MSYFDRSWSRIREFFTLEGAETRTQHLTIEDRIEIRNEHQAAVRLMLEAERAEPAQRRLELARDALQRLVVATAVAKQDPMKYGPRDWPDDADAKAVVATLPGIERYEHVLTWLYSESGPAYRVNRLFSQMAEFVGYLELHIDARTPRDFKVARVARAVGVCAALACLGWIVVAPRNLALGKPVDASSHCAGMPAAPFAEPALVRVVDGVRYEASYAMCTEKERNPWITVDLGRVHSISEIVVYGRTDGNWGVDEIPARLESSVDNEHFEPLGVTDMPYVPDQPWDLKLMKKPARFIRLAAGSDNLQQFFINELEVYGY